VLDAYALLVRDSNPTYGEFCKTEKVSHEVINMSQCQLDHFHGVATKYPPNYLGWCRVVDRGNNLTPEILLHYALEDFQHLTAT